MYVYINAICINISVILHEQVHGLESNGRETYV